MKKLLSIALISSLLLSRMPTHAKHHSHKPTGNKVLSGAWQFVKIGGGLFMIGSGTVVGGMMCGVGCCGTCWQKDCLPCLGCETDEEIVESCRQCGTLGIIGGGILRCKRRISWRPINQKWYSWITQTCTSKE